MFFFVFIDNKSWRKHKTRPKPFPVRVLEGDTYLAIASGSLALLDFDKEKQKMYMPSDPPTKRDWQVAELSINIEKMFIAYMIYIGFCVSENDFKVKYGGFSLPTIHNMIQLGELSKSDDIFQLSDVAKDALDLTGIDFPLSKIHKRGGG